jgi:predicted DNA-binding protein with PD1-like motif
MNWTLLDEDTGTYLLVADPGDEAVEVLTAFAVERDLTAGQITAIGAFERAAVGWFDRGAKEYRRIRINQQCEVLSLIGYIALADDKPQVHAHAVLGLSDGAVRGGHLLAGYVWPTLEMVIRDTPAVLRETSRPDLGLALIDLPRTARQ